MVRKDSVQKLSPIWSVLLRKIGKKDFQVIHDFCVFGLSHLQNDLQIKIWPDPPNIFWEYLIFLFLWLFLSGRSLCLKILFKIYFYLFALLITFLFDFSYFSSFFLSSYIQIHAAGLQTVCSFFILPVGVKKKLRCGCPGLRFAVGGRILAWWVG